MLTLAPLELDLGAPPEDRASFAREVEVVVEATDDYRRYAACFHVEVCTAAWLADRARAHEWAWGARRLVVPAWDPPAIERALKALVTESGETDWLPLMRHLARYLEPEELPPVHNAA